jgi:hypothetical protein
MYGKTLSFSRDTSYAHRGSMIGEIVVWLLVESLNKVSLCHNSSILGLDILHINIVRKVHCGFCQDCTTLVHRLNIFSDLVISVPAVDIAGKLGGGAL